MLLIVVQENSASQPETKTYDLTLEDLNALEKGFGFSAGMSSKSLLILPGY